MPLFCANFAIRVPHALIHSRRSNFIPNHVASSFLLFLDSKKSIGSSKPIVSLSKFNQTHLCSSTMEDQNQLVLTSSEPEKYFKELEVAVRAVQMACLLCQRVQDSLVSQTNGQVQSKDDNSPVTIAGTNRYVCTAW
ncbi:hypothetical protein CsSME_00032110 [Camellia sinensis var. sinensis]